MASTRVLISLNSLVAMPPALAAEQSVEESDPDLIDGNLNVSADKFADLLLEPTELINAVLPHVSDCLDEASTAWSEEQFEEVSAHLNEAFSLLQVLNTAVLPEPVSEPPKPEVSPMVDRDVATKGDDSAEAEWSKFLTVAA